MSEITDYCLEVVSIFEEIDPIDRINKNGGYKATLRSGYIIDLGEDLSKMNHVEIFERYLNETQMVKTENTCISLQNTTE